MNPQPENAFLFPDSVNDTSRYSTPRSSIGEGVSTDCEADVESNVSANSEIASPHRRRSSNGIYGIVKANKAIFTSRKANEMLSEVNENDQDRLFGWKTMSSSQKLAILSSVVICLLFILGFVFLFPHCRNDCNENDTPKHIKIKGGSNWPVEFRNASPTTKMMLTDVNMDGKKEILFALSKNYDEQEIQSDTNTSIIIAVDADNGVVLKKVYIDFQAFWIHCDANDFVNASCFVVSHGGTIAKVNMVTQETVWSFKPCSSIHSVSEIKDIDLDAVLDLIVVCSWQSTENSMISGIALVSGIRGEVLGSKIRYQLSQLPSSFLMQHIDAQNNTCILFGTQRNNKSTIWAVRLKRLVEIATGARRKVNLVSENPLLVVRNVKTNIRPVHYDISSDGIKDIGFVLQHGLIAFIDGATLKLRKTIDARRGEIISISVLPVKNFKRPLLAVFKTTNEKCENAVLSIYNFRNSFDPYMIELPTKPTLITEMDPAKKKLFVMLLKDKPKSCTRTDEVKKAKPAEVDKDIINLPTLKRKQKTNEEDFNDELLIKNGTNDIDIDAIDKDVLENLREYIGINDMGVTRYHKLFHLVCNYLLLRFLISYGITTESVLKDFRSTRSHLLNLSNRNLGHVLTNQLKGLLATDYSKDSDFVPLLDDLDNDIEWLKDVEVKEPIRRKRRDLGIDVWASDGDTIDSPRGLENGRFEWKNSLKKVLRDINEASQNPSNHQSNISTNKTRGGIERSKERLKNSIKNCITSVPTFKMLEINKANFSWKNISTETGNRNMEDNTEEDGCSKMDFEVKDLLVYNHRLYYLSQYFLNNINTNQFVTQLNWLNLHY